MGKTLVLLGPAVPFVGILFQMNTGPSARFHVRCSLLWFLFTCLILYSFMREFNLNFIGRPQRYCRLPSGHHDKVSIAIKGDTKIFWLPQACEHYIHTTPKFNNCVIVICLKQHVQFSCSCPTLCNPMDCGMPSFPVHHQLLELAQTHVHHPSSVVPFSSRLQAFPASGPFPVSQLFASGGQSIGVSASTSVLPMNIQD